MADLSSAILAPEKTLVIVVDMEHDFCSPGGLRYNPKSGAIVPTLRAFLGRARKNRVPIIWCHSVRDQTEAAVTVFNYDHILQDGAWGSEILPDLLPRPDDIHVYKRSHNIWWQTDLEKKLGAMVTRPSDTNVIVMGVAAAGCAYRAVMGFHLNHFWTYVPLDCVDDNEWAKHQFALADYYNVFPTRSDLLHFGPVARMTETSGEDRRGASATAGVR